MLKSNPLSGWRELVVNTVWFGSDALSYRLLRCQQTLHISQTYNIQDQKRGITLVHRNEKLLIS